MTVVKELEELLKAAEAGYAQDLKDFAIPLARDWLTQHEALYRIRTYGGPSVCAECRGEEDAHLAGCFVATFSNQARAALDRSELEAALEPPT